MDFLMGVTSLELSEYLIMNRQVKQANGNIYEHNQQQQTVVLVVPLFIHGFPQNYRIKWIDDDQFLCAHHK